MDFIIILAIWLLFLYLMREMEMKRLASHVELNLMLFKAARDRAYALAVKKLGEVASKSSSRVNLDNIEAKVKDLVEAVSIHPVNLDPFAFVQKLKHVLESEEKLVRASLKGLAPQVGKSELEVTTSVIWVARALNFIYKVVYHFYSLAKKYRNYYLLMQLHALLPFIAEEVRIYEGALDALLRQVPIGDAAGPLTVVAMVRELKAKPMDVGVPDTRVYVSEWESRTIILVKAEGPGSSVGKLDEVTRRILDVWGGSLSLVVTVDAMAKFEGEKTGEVAEGFGVAMGGTGVERFGIEELLTEYRLRPYAVLVKMSPEETLLPVGKELLEACSRAKERVMRAISAFSEPGTAVLVMGVGNTLGVGN